MRELDGADVESKDVTLPPTDRERVLSAGVNFTNRPELKYARAVHLANELRGRIDEWSASETLLARLHQIDDHTVQFRLEVRSRPPIDEWSLILGDALHNLRSVFDTAIWALATLDGAEPKSPTQVMFPLTANEGEWRKRIKTLESVPSVFLERIRQLQPWADGAERDDSLLWLLHRFDIVDKHRGLISGALHFKQLTVPGLELNFRPADTAGDAQATYEIQKDPIQAQDGTVLTTIRCSTHTMHPEPGYLARVQVQFRLHWDEERGVFLDAFLGDLISRTRQWLDIIYGGRTYAQAQAMAREGTGPNIVSGYHDETGKLHLLRFQMGEPD